MPIPVSEQWEANGSNMELPDKAMNHDARPALHRGISAFRTSVYRYIYIFFPLDTVLTAPLLESHWARTFSDASSPFALGLLWKIYLCVRVCVCVCNGLFYPSIDHFSFLLRVLDRLDRYTEFRWIGGAVKERFRHRLIVDITRLR